MTSSWAFRNVGRALLEPGERLACPSPARAGLSSWVSSVCRAAWAASNFAFQVSCSALSPAARASSIICSAMYMRSGSAWARSASRIRRTVFSPVWTRRSFIARVVHSVVAPDAMSRAISTPTPVKSFLPIVHLPCIVDLPLSAREVCIRVRAADQEARRSERPGSRLRRPCRRAVDAARLRRRAPRSCPSWSPLFAVLPATAARARSTSAASRPTTTIDVSA